MPVRTVCRRWPARSSATIVPTPGRRPPRFLVVCAAAAALASCSLGSSSGFCSTADRLVRRITERELGYTELRAEGRCTVTGDGPLRSVDYAYSSPDTRERELPPVPYRARVAYDERSGEYYLCEVTYFPDDRRAKTRKYARHPLCAR